jgi:hypothetical protein
MSSEFAYQPSSGLFFQRKFHFRFNKDLSSLKCEERQKNKLIEIIRSALNEVSCEELPSGCDDLSVEIDNNNLGNHEVSRVLSNLTIQFLVED